MICYAVQPRDQSATTKNLRQMCLKLLQKESFNKQQKQPAI